VTEDSPFNLEEIEMMSIILEKKIMIWVREYTALYPGVLQITNNAFPGVLPRSLENNRVGFTLKAIRKRHENMEGYIILVKQLKSMLRIYRGTVHERTITIRRSEYDDIVMAHTNSGNITLMARGKEPFTKEEELEIKEKERRNWLQKDALLTQQLIDIRNKNCPEDEKTARKNKAMKQAVDRYNKFVEEQQENNIDRDLENDEEYQQEVDKINNSRMSNANKLKKIEIAKEEFYTRKELDDLLENNSGGYKKDTTKYPKTVSIQHNKKTKPTMSDIDYHLSSNDKSTLSNQKKRKAESSSSKPISSNNKSLSSSPNKFDHDRLTNHQNSEIIHLLKKMYPDTYAALHQNIMLTENLLSLEAKVSHKSVINEDQDSDEDTANDSIIDEEEEESIDQYADNIAFIRMQDHNNMDGENEFDEETINSLPVQKKSRLSKNNQQPLHKNKPSPKKTVVKTKSNSSNSKSNKKSPPPPPRNHPSRDRKPTSK
jgi:hypothetical protein